MSDTGELKVTTPSDLEIAMTRAFDAPRRLVFDAYTKPELLTRWLGVRDGWSMAVCEVDLRVGGAYRWVWRGEGPEIESTGVYREIVRPERVVSTERMRVGHEANPGEALDTLMLVEENGKTTSTWTMRFETKEGRDMALQSGMDRGVAESYDVLDTLLSSIAAPR
jgi:uncharacterized protein YndB with AHSA1/START domain